MADLLAVHAESFLPLQVTEDRLEGLLIDTEMFRPYQYVNFKPAVWGPEGSRHPDGALVAPGQADWWVVEVEVAGHDVERHVRPQLHGLAQAVWGPKAVGYLWRAGMDETLYATLRSYEPQFLLIADHLTPALRQAASSAGFQSMECSVFRSSLNRYALAVQGALGLPQEQMLVVPQGVDVTLTEICGVAVLRPTTGRAPRCLQDSILLGRDLVRVWVTGDGAIALPIAPSECRRICGGSNSYRLTVNGELVPHL